MDLGSRKFWIFDLDGTLTRAVHDFPTIRANLGLADGAPILESIEAMAADEKSEALEKVAAWERALVARAEPQPSAEELLTRLSEQGAVLGIVTRNLTGIAQQTLAQVKLASFFAHQDIIGRDRARAKPSPAGIKCLLERWRGRPDQSVMVGDWVFDAQAGRSAGAATVLLDPVGRTSWRPFADLVIRDLRELLDLVSG